MLGRDVPLVVAAAAVVALLVSACGGGEPPVAAGGGDVTSASPPRPAGLLLLTADDGGAIALDRTSAALVGLDRAGRRVWTDKAAPEQGATAVCLGRCPAAVVSGGDGSDRPDPAPRVLGTVRAAPLRLPAATHRRVLTARSPTDAVVEERTDGGPTYLRIVRPDGDRRIEVPTADYAWAESPDHGSALALSRVPDAPGAMLLRFGRDGGGWRLVADSVPRGRIWDACLAAGGRLAVLVGPDAAVLRDGTDRRPLRTDLASAGECTAGRDGGAVVQRSNDSTGAVRTGVRGIGPDGTQTWSRDLDGEATVAADPTGDRVAVAHGGTLELIDRTGRVLDSRRGVRSALFTPAGDLVTADLAGVVRWEPPRR